MTQFQRDIKQKTLPSLRKVVGFTVLALACASMAGCFGSKSSKSSRKRSTTSSTTTSSSTETDSSSESTETETGLEAATTTASFNAAAINTLKARAWSAYSNGNYCLDSDTDSCSQRSIRSGMTAQAEEEVPYKNYVACIARPEGSYNLDPNAAYSSLSQSDKNTIEEKLRSCCTGWVESTWDDSEGYIGGSAGFTHIASGMAGDFMRWESYETGFPDLTTTGTGAIKVKDAIINLANRDIYEGYCYYQTPMSSY